MPGLPLGSPHSEIPSLKLQIPVLDCAVTFVTFVAFVAVVVWCGCARYSCNLLRKGSAYTFWGELNVLFDGSWLTIQEREKASRVSESRLEEERLRAMKEGTREDNGPISFVRHGYIRAIRDESPHVVRVFDIDILVGADGVAEKNLQPCGC